VLGAATDVVLVLRLGAHAGDAQRGLELVEELLLVRLQVLVERAHGASRG
jgi:hypothetical protein